jgi:hypothetical protein
MWQRYEKEKRKANLSLFFCFNPPLYIDRCEIKEEKRKKLKKMFYFCTIKKYKLYD